MRYQTVSSYFLIQKLAKIKLSDSSNYLSVVVSRLFYSGSIEDDALLPHIAVYWVHLLDVEALLVSANARV